MDAADLYLLPPEGFTAARDAAVAQARADGDRSAAVDLKALRRPSVSAWLVNRLATAEAELLDSLLGLGRELAEAQAIGSGDLLRELSAQRRSLVEAVTARAVGLADRQVPAAVRAEVSGTLEAALSDPASARAVRSGRLVRALSYAGFGGVDLDGAVASTSSGAAPPEPRAASRARRSSAGRSQRAVAAAEAAALAAGGELDDAVRRCERLSAEAESAAQDLAGARERASRADEAVDAAQHAARAAQRAVQDAERAAEQARREAAELEQRSSRAARRGEQAVERVRDAQLAAERSRTALDELRRAHQA